MIEQSLHSLIKYIENESFKGYDPYDTLNSAFDFSRLGKWGSLVITQIQKRNPVNIRPLLGIRKGINPKGIGLLLKAYCLLYNKTGDNEYLEKAGKLFEWLSDNFSKGFSGFAWGYDFDWVSPNDSIKAYTPSVVVTSFVIDGIFEFYKITNNSTAKNIISKSAEYIVRDIPVVEFKEGLSFSYTHINQDCCYNASLLASEILAKAGYITKSSKNNILINKAIDYVLSRQKPDGEWWYSINLETGKERRQIDFHQGFILVSLAELNKFLDIPRKDIEEAVEKGLYYYRHKQFYENGRSLWRIPKRWPVDIHNQSQGIITFSRLKEYGSDYLSFAKTIANWTIKNMQSNKGYFYYRKNPLYTNKISYIRWSQAWMMVALSELISNE